MEKGTPNCALRIVKGLAADGKIRATYSALSGAAHLGLDWQAMLNVIRHLKSSDFRKSMTTYSDHRIWQDVYCTETVVGPVYLKLVVIDDVLIVSFKEK
jgi:motility quorum-sensing regulator / GCU-specific mRNA interferase toxin